MSPRPTLVDDVVRPPRVAATCEPRPAPCSWFTGAVLPVCGVEVLIVAVQPQVMFEIHEANLYVTAFYLRFRRTIVLMSQEARTDVPTFYGPAGIVQVLATLPFELIPWKRMLYRVAKPITWQLPIPPEPPAEETPRFESSSLARDADSSLAQTSIYDPRRDAGPTANHRKRP